MGIAHKDTTLPIKTCLPVDKNTVFLAHYDITEEESLSGIRPYDTPIATLRPMEGKYGGAIAVEEGTTNEDATPTNNYANLGDTVTPCPVASPIPNETVWHFASGNFGGWELYPSPTSVAAGTTYTMSWYAYIPSGGTCRFNCQLDSSGHSNYTIYDLSTTVPKPGWYRFVATYTFPSAVTGVRFRIETSIPAIWSNGSNECWMVAPQLEKKSFATSFINGTRAEGILRYPSHIMNPNEGTVSMWVNPNHPQSWSRLFKIGSYSSPVTTDEFRWMFLAQTTNVTDPKTLTFEIQSKDSTNTVATSTGITLPHGQWTHITAVWSKSGNFIRTYKNGVLVSSVTTSGFTFPTYKDFTYVEVGHDGVGARANSMIDELRIDKVARTSEEIEQWYLSQAPFYPKGIHRIWS